jgi:hypothetical protein
LLTEIVFDAPWASVPVSKLCPSSAVAVCAVLSWLVTDVDGVAQSENAHA